MANNLGWHSFDTTVYAFEFYFIPRLSITRRPFLKKNLMLARDEGSKRPLKTLLVLFCLAWLLPLIIVYRSIGISEAKNTSFVGS